MSDTARLVKLIKQAAVDAVNAHDPVCCKIGEVISANPLKISIGNKIILTDKQIILTRAVTDSTVSVDSEAVSISLGLQNGEKVILLRCDGGQKFIVLDRLVTI